ncbi:unnamed protein product [Adineta steineri]|uniref:Uncharacterized protein n=1 Tax=Adineta steineri TaxID=433720 RepID=A0A813MDB4_9BILA|nr:unnamed protein product [Adineta steineri]CAF0736684.1 unnamed protein product [Adineta steineri]CAF3681418.1 unnamed protein product [Adineta steineri]CAF3833104.1 unnamed protein product [Adineta steineri]
MLIALSVVSTAKKTLCFHIDISEKRKHGQRDGHQRKSRCNKYIHGTKFEELPNELCLRYIFVSFDLYSLYHTFYHLNKRYNQLVLSCQNLQLNLKKIPASEFIPSIYHIGTLFSSDSVLSLQNGTSTQIDLLCQDRLFTNLISNIKSLTFSRDTSLDSICELLNIESLQKTIEYLNVKYISWKGCPSEQCSNDDYQEQEAIRQIFTIAFCEMNKLKTLLIFFSEKKYPDGEDFESIFENVKEHSRDSEQTNQSNLTDCIYLHEICPKLKYLEMRTDFGEKILDKHANDEQKNTSITNLCLLFDRWKDAKLSLKKIENFLSYFPTLTTLELNQRALQLTENQWNDLASKTGIDIVNIS